MGISLEMIFDEVKLSSLMGSSSYILSLLWSDSEKKLGLLCK